MNSDLFKTKHALWLKLLFASFAVNDERIKSRLYDFSMIAFRHMKWIASVLRREGIPYGYDRDFKLEEHESVFALLRYLVRELDAAANLYGSSDLFERMQSDERYFLQTLSALLDDEANDAPVTAFDRKRVFPGRELSVEQTDALTLFLFEESYKEYELILVYAYMQNHTGELTHYDVFQDLIDESHFHLKSFGNMMAKMGILALPRELHEMTYKIDDIETFLQNGIEEEENAKEQCRALAESIGDEKLSKFFDFINFQESYHIALMKSLL
jgi:hypothetical protein